MVNIWQGSEYASAEAARQRCSEIMHQVYKRTAISKCDFNKVALQLYWNRTSAWVFSCKFTAYFKNTFSKEHLWMAASGSVINDRTQLLLNLFQNVLNENMINTVRNPRSSFGATSNSVVREVFKTPLFTRHLL